MKIYRAAHVQTCGEYTTEELFWIRKDEQILQFLKGKLLGGFRGQRRQNRKNFLKLKNCEIEDILEGTDVVRMMNVKRIRWYGHEYRGREDSVLERNGSQVGEWEGEQRIVGRSK